MVLKCCGKGSNGKWVLASKIFSCLRSHFDEAFGLFSLRSNDPSLSEKGIKLKSAAQLYAFLFGLNFSDYSPFGRMILPYPRRESSFKSAAQLYAFLFGLIFSDYSPFRSNVPSLSEKGIKL